MRYMRCKCGDSFAWTSMRHPSCSGCPKCNTTLEESPSLHIEPTPHEWKISWNIDGVSGERFQERQCLRCMIVEKLPSET